jgi:hypothetical protein
MLRNVEFAKVRAKKRTAREQRAGAGVATRCNRKRPAVGISWDQQKAGGLNESNYLKGEFEQVRTKKRAGRSGVIKSVFRRYSDKKGMVADSKKK